jgi:putative hydrolase of the HAD superfamily
MIKALTFDFWGTLYHGSMSARPLRMKRMNEVLGMHGHAISQEALDNAERVAWDTWDRVWREEYRTLPSNDWLRLMLEQMRVTLPPGEVDALAAYFGESVLDLEPPLQMVDGMRDVVRRLSERYPLGIISDTGLSSGAVLRRFLERDEILDCFACLSFSDETGVSKPHPDAFLRTLECLGAAPAEAVHLGDLTRTDIAGAKAVGMRAVKFTGANDDADRSALPDATLSTYADFESLIQTWETQDD